MNIHEYQAKLILAEQGLPVPGGKLCLTPTEVEWAAREMIPKEGGVVVVKAQVHAGGRGKAGGVKLAKSAEEARAVAEKMFGMKLVTHQTGPAGKIVKKIFVTEGSKISREYYLAAVLNRDKACISFMLSEEGGMDIEEVAAKSPEKIITIDIDPAVGFKPYAGRRAAQALNLTGPLAKQIDHIMRGILNTFMKYDCSMVEINPLAVVDDNQFQILDCKMSFDDNALFRHKKVTDMRDYDEEDMRELEASKSGLSYVSLDGNIGCLVNGAGLAMATMDIIKQHGGEPANFLDVGGGANQETVTNAFRIILRDTSVKGIFVNIFGGIMKCDVIANGVVSAAKEIGVKVPLVVRLEGTNVDLGKQILKDSGLNIISADSMSDGAKKIVAAVK